MKVNEIYRYKRMTASGVIVPAGGVLGGFLCTTNGTIQITEGVASGGADIVSTMTVAAGTYYPLSFNCPSGAYVVIVNAVGTFSC